MPGWASVLKIGLRYGGKAIKAVGSSLGGAVVHPQRTIKGLGSAGKTLAVGAAATYVGWEKLTTDKSVARIVGDAVVGEKTIDSVGKKVDGVADTISGFKETASNAVESVNNAISDVGSKWNGMSNFLQGVFSGNGGNMLGSFFSNLGRGNVSGLSLAGLVLSAFLIFGRFGWLGKIAGAVLGMMMLGNNVNMAQVLGGQQQHAPAPAPAPTTEPVRQPAPAQQPVPPVAVATEPEIPREQIHRGR